MLMADLLSLLQRRRGTAAAVDEENISPLISVN